MNEARILHARPELDQLVSTRRMFVRDLVLDAHIGVYAYEREARQRVRINMDLAVREDTPVDDRYANVVCYASLVRGARKIAEGPHVNLVETLAERIADMCLEDRRVAAVRVRVEKIEVFPETNGVGIEIERFNDSRLGADLEWFRRGA